MLSRAASSLYWTARYLERAESVARLLDVNLRFSLDLGSDDGDSWAAVVATTGDQTPFLARHGAVNRDAAVAFLAADPGNPNSVVSCVQAARENARAAREYLPSEAWEALNTLHLTVRRLPAEPGDPERLDRTLEAVRSSGRELDGLLATALLRDEGWLFLRLGQSLERADQTSRLVDVQTAALGAPERDGDEAPRWEAVARSANALAMYRRRHGGTDGRKVAEFLLLDGAFPRSVAFCLRSAEESLRAITGTPPGFFGNAAEKGLGRLASELRYTEMADVLREGMHQWLDRFQARLNEVGDAVRVQYFEPPSPEAPGAGSAAGQPQQ